MSVEGKRHRSGSLADPMPLDAVRIAFDWLVSGPAPVAVDGAEFAGLPARAVALDEVRARLLDRSCPQQVRDAVWAHLVARTRADGVPPESVTTDSAATAPAAVSTGPGARAGAGAGGTAARTGTWTVGCAGMALPALTRMAAVLTHRLAGDPRDVHAAVLTGFLAALPVVDLTRPRIMLRLRWAAYRGGLAAVHHQLQAPIPLGDRSTHFGAPLPHRPPQPGGHPDFVLARAIAAGVLTADHAALIVSTRLEGVDLVTAAGRRGASYQATKKARRRAEQRLHAYLVAVLDDTDGVDGAELRSDPVAATVTQAVVGAASPGARRSRTVTGIGRGLHGNPAPEMPRTGGRAGVQSGVRPPAPNSAPDPTADAVDPSTDPGVQEPRCA